MPITRKNAAKKQLERLDTRVAELRRVLTGTEPDTALHMLYSLNADDFQRDFVFINQDDLAYALADLETVVKELKKAGTLKAHKLHNPR